jgi:hypothetical protein
MHENAEAERGLPAVSIARLAGPAALALAIPAVFLAPGGHAVTASLGGPAVTSRAAMATYSPNWGGYVASGTTFQYIKATFTVSRLDCAKTPGTAKTPTMVGQWVGLDSSSVEQDGIEGECDGTTAKYSAWYEMYPKQAVYPAMAVNGGDTVQASVWYAASKHEYELILTDLTNGQGFTKWARCGKDTTGGKGGTCQNSSAEVITEAPGKPGGGYFPLADSGTTSYTGISITNAAGQQGTFTSGNWLTTRFVMQNGSGRVKAAIGGLTGGGSAFQTYWERES